METVNHFGFIAAAYAAAVIVVGTLVIWVTLDYRTQRRKLAELESRGINRRSAPLPPERAMQRAKEQA